MYFLIKPWSYWVILLSESWVSQTFSLFLASGGVEMIHSKLKSDTRCKYTAMTRSWCPLYSNHLLHWYHRCKITIMKEHAHEKSLITDRLHKKKAPSWQATHIRDHPHERNAQDRLPQWKNTLMRYHPHERPPLWKTTLQKDRLHERTLMRDHPNERTHSRQITFMKEHLWENNLMKEHTCDRLPSRKNTLMIDHSHERTHSRQTIFMKEHTYERPNSWKNTLKTS